MILLLCISLMKLFFRSEINDLDLDYLKLLVLSMDTLALVPKCLVDAEVSIELCLKTSLGLHIDSSPP